MNIPNWLRVGIGVAIASGAYLGGIYIGDLRATTRASSERCADRDELLALVGRQSERLAAIDAILLDCETIHGDRGPDGVWTFALFKGDGTAREVEGRTLDVLIGGAQ